MLFLYDKVYCKYFFSGRENVSFLFISTIELVNSLAELRFKSIFITLKVKLG